MTELRGVGIGLGVAQGPVARMAEPLPAPGDAPERAERRGRDGAGAGGRRRRRPRARAARRAGRRCRAGRARGAGDDGRGPEPRSRDRRAHRRRARPPSAPCTTRSRRSATRSPRWAATSASARPTSTTSPSASSRGCAACPLPACPTPGIRSCSSRRISLPPTPPCSTSTRCSRSITTEGGPTSHTAILAREKSIVAVVGAVAAKGLVDGEMVIVDAAAGVVTTQPDRRGARARAEPRGRPRVGGIRADHRRRARRRHPGAAAGEPRQARGRRRGRRPGRRGRRAVPHRVPLPQREPGADRRAAARVRTRSCSRRSRARRSSCGCSMPGADKPLAVPQRRARGEPGAGPARHPRAARERGHPARAAHGPRRSGCRDPTAATCGSWRRWWRRSRRPSTSPRSPATTASRPPASWSRCPPRRCSPTASSQHADFASIGTNDLTQYTLAADRLLGSVASFQDPWHPAVLRLIREVGDAGRIHGKPVGICGEAAADPLLAVVLVGLGATSLSMAPTALADVRASLLQHSLDDARVIAEAALAANDAASARDAARAAAATR